MLIDFHVHFFPDRIAQASIEKLENISNLKAYTNGTLNDTIEKMAQWNVDKFVLLNIATAPKQQDSILRSCIAIREEHGDKIIPFPSVHPDAENALEMLDTIADEGFKGIKLHPDYQNFFIDEERVIPIFEKCAELGLLVTIHAGYDPVSPDVVHAPPAGIARLIDRIPELKLIAAHFGSSRMWDEVEQHLAGKNAYLDTSFSSGHMPLETAKRLIRLHGADKILLASDCPWNNCADEKEFILSTGCSAEEAEMIFHGNAERLLNV